MDAPSAWTARAVQDFTATPSSNTVQAPHWLVSQPIFVPVTAPRSRIKCTSSCRGSTSRSYTRPFKVMLTGNFTDPPLLLGFGGANHVVVVFDGAPIERGNKIAHGKQKRIPMEVGPELRRGAVARARVDQRPNENAVGVQRKHSDIRIEILPIVGAHKEILLDIRRIEGRHGCVVFAQVFTNGTERSRSGEVSNDRNDQITLLETLQC